MLCARTSLHPGEKRKTLFTAGRSPRSRMCEQSCRPTRTKFAVSVSFELRRHPRDSRNCPRTQWHLSPRERYWFCPKFQAEKVGGECRNSFGGLIVNNRARRKSPPNSSGWRLAWRQRFGDSSRCRRLRFVELALNRRRSQLRTSRDISTIEIILQNRESFVLALLHPRILWNYTISR